MTNTKRRRPSAGEIIEMRRYFDAGHTIRDLIRKYSLPREVVSRICNRKTYVNVPDDLEPIAPARAPAGPVVSTAVLEEMRIDESTRPEMERCSQGCCQRTAAWIGYAERVDVAAERGRYGLRWRKPYRTSDPVVLYAYELDKVLFRIELAGIEVYSVLSVREYSDYYQEERIMAKTMMVIAQLAMMGGTTVFAVADELRATGAFDNLTAGQCD